MYSPLLVNFNLTTDVSHVLLYQTLNIKVHDCTRWVHIEKYAAIYLCAKNSPKIECAHFNDSNDFTLSTLKMAAAADLFLH